MKITHTSIEEVIINVLNKLTFLSFEEKILVVKTKKKLSEADEG